MWNTTNDTQILFHLEPRSAHECVTRNSVLWHAPGCVFCVHFPSRSVCCVWLDEKTQLETNFRMVVRTRFSRLWQLLTFSRSQLPSVSSQWLLITSGLTINHPFSNCIRVFLASLKTMIVSSARMMKTTWNMKVSCVSRAFSKYVETNWRWATRGCLVVEGRAYFQSLSLRFWKVCNLHFFLTVIVSAFRWASFWLLCIHAVLPTVVPVCHAQKHGGCKLWYLPLCSCVALWDMSVAEMWSKYLTNASHQSQASWDSELTWSFVQPSHVDVHFRRFFEQSWRACPCHKFGKWLKPLDVNMELRISNACLIQECLRRAWSVCRMNKYLFLWTRSADKMVIESWIFSARCIRHCPCQTWLDWTPRWTSSSFPPRCEDKFFRTHFDSFNLFRNRSCDVFFFSHNLAFLRVPAYWLECPHPCLKKSTQVSLWQVLVRWRERNVLCFSLMFPLKKRVGNVCASVCVSSGVLLLLAVPVHVQRCLGCHPRRCKSVEWYSIAFFRSNSVNAVSS